MSEKLSKKEFFNKILTGMSIGIIVALVPSALLGELAKLVGLQMVVSITTIASRLVALIIGLCIAMQFKFTPIQSGTLAIATMIGSGALKITESGFVLAGMGDIINAGITAIIATLLIILIGDKLKAYTVLLLPTIVITVAGYIGIMSLPYVGVITSVIGDFVAKLTDLQPALMGTFMSVAFAFIIISPLSSVGIALAVSLSGIASGTANLGICAAGFGLAVLGFSVNGLGTSAAHFLGSPKMQMANFVKNPTMIIPVVFNAAIIGLLGALAGIQGTPMSAGFGISGFIGPINNLNIVGYSLGQVINTVVVFIVLPLVIGYISKIIFMDKLKMVKAEDYLIEFK
ncbi:PTS sugar transporter subunit IIC [Clostridium botulinum]|nr:PTS sugar transporter subunit IIC [Clostridium botulinum]